MKNYAMPFMAIALLVLAGCSQSPEQAGNVQQGTAPGNNSPGPANSGAAQSFSLQEVTQHNTPQDCWMAINENVYNMTDFISNSPNAKTLDTSCGTDATAAFGNRRPQGNGNPGQDQNRTRGDASSFRPDANGMRRDFNASRQDINAMRQGQGRGMFQRYYIGKLGQ
ncbi:Cytochrome b5-like Heme/Steroid binding domain protein [uncultured archaeon]|nr:Cytochrome b5-like Heme/Steroid binding domain protein [uncultured archaeon]